ncbi:MAG: 1-pyrroline-5-carboxylate dehydrogenase, partial [Planctomycetota bacterium]
MQLGGWQQQIAKHLQEYFEEVNSHLPGAARLAIEHSGPNTVLGRALAFSARTNARRMADRFIAGETAEQVLHTPLRTLDTQKTPPTGAKHGTGAAP